MTDILKSTAKLVAVTSLLFTVQEKAVAQYRSTRSELRELKSRFEGLIELHEALAPTLRRMDQQLRQLQKHVNQMDSSSSKQEAHRDLTELRQRVAMLGQQFEKGISQTKSSSRQLASLQSEFEILETRVAGLEQRLEAIERSTRSRTTSLDGWAATTYDKSRSNRRPHRVVGCCPGCGARLVMDSDGAVWHSRETSDQAARYPLAGPYDDPADVYDAAMRYASYDSGRIDDDPFYVRDPRIRVYTERSYESIYRSKPTNVRLRRTAYSGTVQVYEVSDPYGTFRGVAVFVGRGR